MKRLGIACLSLGAITLFVLTAASQPPDGRGPGRPDGPPSGPSGPPDGPAPFEGPGGRPPRFAPGRVLPPHFREELGLSSEQQKKLDDLEKEVKDRLMRILTTEQKQKLERLRQRGPGGPPPGGPGRPPRGEGRPERPDRPPPARPDRDAARTDPPSAGIQWFATWESGLREARRTGRPILLVSAAPHCAGVSGIW